MDYAEEAKANLETVISGKGSVTKIQIAQVQSNLAVLEAVTELSAQVAQLREAVERGD